MSDQHSFMHVGPCPDKPAHHTSAFILRYPHAASVGAAVGAADGGVGCGVGKRVVGKRVGAGVAGTVGACVGAAQHGSSPTLDRHIPNPHGEEYQ